MSEPVESKIDPKVVRAWAKANGKTVGARGRLDAKLVAEYVAATESEILSTPEVELEVVEERKSTFGFPF